MPGSNKQGSLCGGVDITEMCGLDSNSCGESWVMVEIRQEYYVKVFGSLVSSLITPASYWDVSFNRGFCLPLQPASAVVGLVFKRH